MTWNHDITAAPRDGTHVILAMPKNKTLRSYWCKPKNDPEHWCMLSHKDEPLAWMPWPEHPFIIQPEKATKSRVGLLPGAAGADGTHRPAEGERSVEAAGGAALALTNFILEDVGGGA